MRRSGVRQAIVVLLVAGGLTTGALTEVLSFTGRLTREHVVAGWTLLVLPLALALATRRVCLPRARPPRLAPWPDAVAVGAVAVIAAVTLLAGVATIPSTWDSLTYHLARVAHWAQDGSIAFYPTHVIRQLYQPPWAEYAVLHIYLVTGGDALASLVQWLAFAGCLCAVSLVSRELGADRPGQILAALGAATLPMGVLQASSTQNDYVAALWLVCMAWGLVASAIPGRRRALDDWLAGAAFGLALLTKGTANIFAVPIVAVHLLLRWRESPRAAIRTAAVLAGCALAVNGPHYARNSAVFGFPLGPRGEGQFTYLNQAVSPSIVLSNASRNAALHLGTPWPAANRALQDAIEALHAVIGQTVDDPRTTWPNSRFHVPPWTVHEDFTGNGVHLLVFLGGAAVAVWMARRSPSAPRVTAYAAGLAIGAVLFCAVLRWQPWHGRLHLPLFVLAAPLLGVAARGARPRWTIGMAAALALAAAPFVGIVAWRAAASGVAHADRSAQWWDHAARVRPDYVEAARSLGTVHCRRIGLLIGSDDPEYLLWRLVPGVERGGALNHVLVENASRAAAPATRRPPPCAVVADRDILAGDLALEGRLYRPLPTPGRTRVLVPADRGGRAGRGFGADSGRIPPET